MHRNIFLANRLREVLLNGHWIANTNYQAQLQNLNWEQATQQVNGLNTIAALTFHVNYYLAGLNNAFKNGNLTISDKYSFNLTPINNQVDWDNLVQAFLTNASAFIAAVESMDDKLFDQPFTKEEYGTYWRNIEGVIEHCYYHLGQLVLVKKLVLNL